MKTLYLDTETTGLDAAKIVEIGLADDSGPVFEALVNPGVPIPAGATRVHGITDEMVKDAPPLEHFLPRVSSIVGRYDRIVVYNLEYDTGLFPKGFFIGKRLDCAMLRAAAYNRSRGRGDRWQKLEIFANSIGHRWEGKAHRAMADTLAAASVWRWLEARFPCDPDCKPTIDGYYALRQRAIVAARKSAAPAAGTQPAHTGPMPTKPLFQEDGVFGLSITIGNLKSGRLARENVKIFAAEAQDIRNLWETEKTQSTVLALASRYHRSTAEILRAVGLEASSLGTLPQGSQTCSLVVEPAVAPAVAPEPMNFGYFSALFSR